MKKLLFFALACITLLWACAPSKKVAVPSNLEGKWKLVVFPYQNKTLAELFGERVAELEFNGNNQFYGTTGCNRISGNYYPNGDTLRFAENMAMTRMACPGFDENLITNAWQRINRFRIIESELTLLQDSMTVMVLARQQAGQSTQ